MEFVFENDKNADIVQNTFDIVSPSSQSRSQGATMASSRQAKKARRTLPKSFSDIEFNEPPKRSRRKTTGPKVNYVKSVKKKKRKTAKSFKWTWTKLGWVGCGFLVLRLFFMESGVLDYHKMNQTLIKKQNNLELLRLENAELIREIHRIKTSPVYQKKLARDHLGVIAKDEYLVLFSRDSVASSL
ncbi:MAG: septum formation initiator family protein [Bacteriovoracaceae bacterium]|nr:hypothetical protein [Halobacteriovoraceae bacterium]MDP7320196.1 septum formation initiator family protein [Bacteriovoracaceae bacterium]